MTLGRWFRSAVVLGTCTLALIACGGSDTVEEADNTGSDRTDATSIADIGDETPEPTRTRQATATAVALPTLTPPATATPLPSPTPLPLEAPTPAAIILSGAFTNSSKVTTVGIDEVFFGMPVAEAAVAASTEWVGEPRNDTNCYTVTPSTGPDGVSLIVVDGRVERVDITNTELRTPSRFGVGNTLEELQGQLGDRLDAVENADGSTTATFTPVDAGDADYRIVFEVVDGRVESYRSGRATVINRPLSEC